MRPLSARGCEIALAGAGAAGLVGVLALPSLTATSDPGGVLTRNTIRLALLWYAAATALMLWQSPDTLWRPARACWTVAWACYLVHLGMAFHYHHHWSHEEAFRHVEEGSGFGPGIFVSYAFTLLWTADVIWWWVRPASHARRPAWLRRSLYGFMAFVVFNGAVVFAQGAVRWVGAAAFLLLALVWLRRRDAVGQGATPGATAWETSQTTVP
jgi:hypothetical protein